MRGKPNLPQQERHELFEHLEKWATFIMANLLWFVLSIPIITLPLATAGLFTVMSLWVRGKPVNLFSEFLGAMREHWLKSTLIFLIDLVVGGLLVLNFSIFPHMDMTNPVAFLSRSVTAFAALILIMTNFYVWSLMVALEMPLLQLIKTAFRLVFSHPLWTIGIFAAASAVLGIGLLFPALILITVLASSVVYVINWGTWRIIRRYLPEEDRQKLEALRI